MLRKVPFWMESVLATVTHPLVFPHLNDFVPILSESFHFLLSSSKKITHSHFSVRLFPSILVFEDVMALRNNLVLFVTDWTSVPITAMILVYCVGRHMIAIYLQLKFLLMIENNES